MLVNPLSAEHFLKITKNLMKNKANLLTFLVTFGRSSSSNLKSVFMKEVQMQPVTSNTYTVSCILSYIAKPTLHKTKNKMGHKV